MSKQEDLNAFASKGVDVIVKCQNILAEYVVPDSKVTDHQCINRLLGVLDDQNLVREMREKGFIPTPGGAPESNVPEKGPVLTKTWEESGNVEVTKYQDGILEITFKNSGGTYQYYDVPKEVWDQLVQAVSIGSFMAREIKGHYRYVRV